jgi:5-methylcytosine-specific restriction endonuclease McrA
MPYYNYNKHRHLGMVYKTWKKCKHEHKSFIKNCLKGYLNEFWAKFNRLDKQGKIDLLKEASYQKYKYNNRYHKNRRKTFGIKNIPCQVCGKKPTCTHHIILLKNGGINKRVNYIHLCELCHAQIHEWMLEEILYKMNEELDAEYRAIVGL